MHEFVFARSITEEIGRMKDPLKEISSVEIELGELVGIEWEELEGVLKEQLPYMEFKGSIKESVVRCECGYIGKAHVEERLHDLVVFSCPKCGAVPEILEGDKIKLVRINYR